MSDFNEPYITADKTACFQKSFVSLQKSSSMRFDEVRYDSECS